MALDVDKIVVVNDGGFVMKFWISVNVPGDKKLYWTNNNSGDYAVGQDRTFDLSQGQPAIPPGSTVWPTVKAEGGNQVDGDAKFTYKPGSNRTVTFRARGTTLNYSVNLVK
jgi:hypothetical protein